MSPPSNSSSAQAKLPSANPTKSFWLQNLSPFLDGHRTTADLPAEADVVIIGSGITGASVAHFLLQDPSGASKSVLMVEAREACSGATGRNGGHCQPIFLGSEPGVYDFEIKNYDELDQFISSNEIPCAWKRRPACFAFFDGEAFAGAREQYENQSAADQRIARNSKVVVDPVVLERLQIPKAVGAFVNAREASVWPYKLVAWMLEQLVQTKGLNLQTNTPVERLESSADGRWTLHTPRGIIHSRHVVLATNAYTSSLLPEFAGLIMPVRGHVSALQPVQKMQQTAETYCFFGLHTSNLDHADYLIQWPDDKEHHGTLIFGGARYVADGKGEGEGDDSQIDKKSVEYLRETLPKVMKLPSLESGNPVSVIPTYEWSGIMGYSSDEIPWVGAVPDKHGLWIAAGYTGHGMPNAFLSGRAVAQMVASAENGKDQQAVEEELVATGGLPACYLVSRARVENNGSALDSGR